MPYRICKTFTVESGHLLSGHPRECRFPHGHSRTIELVLSADSLDSQNMVCDFKALRPVIETCVQRYDHTLAMNTADPQFSVFKEAYGDHVISFEEENPTTEAMARDIHRIVARFLREGSPDNTFAIRREVRLERVRVSETASSWAEYSE